MARQPGSHTTWGREPFVLGVLLVQAGCTSVETTEEHPSMLQRISDKPTQKQRRWSEFFSWARLVLGQRQRDQYVKRSSRLSSSSRTSVPNGSPHTSTQTSALDAPMGCRAGIDVEHKQLQWFSIKLKLFSFWLRLSQIALCCNLCGGHVFASAQLPIRPPCLVFGATGAVDATNPPAERGMD